jgi:ABC-2 type transport system permease protein
MGLRPKAGSVLWLLLHEMRLGWREQMKLKGRVASILLAGFLILGLLSGGLGLGFALRDVEVTATPLVAIVADAALALIFTLMLSQTLASAAQALYSRGDLDLLFSSPLPPRTVLTVRFSAMALNVGSLFLVLAGGLLIPIAIMGHPAWLAALPVIFALALLASATGLLLATALFRVLGPRRTRAVSQVLAALIGAALFLASQAGNLAGRGDRRAIFERFGTLAGQGDLKLPPLVDLPARAMLGEPLPLLAILGGALLVFLAVTNLLGRRFAKDAATAVGVDGARKARGTVGGFADGVFAATLGKELRLLVRDIALLSQVLLRVLYILPLGFVLLRNAHDHTTLLLPGGAAALAVMAGQLTASLAWITVSAEDAPDLLVASPAPIGLINRAKLAAALIPVGLLLAAPLGWLTVLAPATGVAAILGCAASAISAGVISIWRQRPGRRADFRRKGNVHWFVAIAILLINMLWGAATALAAMMLPWAIIPAVLGAAFTLVFHKSDTAIRETLRGGD